MGINACTSAANCNAIVPSETRLDAGAPNDVTPLLQNPEETALTCSGDLGAAIAAMLLIASKNQRAAAREAKEAALASEVAAHRSRIDNMEKAAEKRFVGGMTSGFTTIGAGGMTLAGGTCSEMSNQKKFEGGGKAGDGAGKVAEAFFARDASEADRAAETDEQAAKQAGRTIERAIDDAKDANDLLRRAMEHYKEFLTAKEDAKRAALFRA